MKIHLNIGSNIGHRRSQLEMAVAALSDALPGKYHVSDPVETPAWGYESPNSYINIGVMIETAPDLPLAELLERVMTIQKGICPDAHRTPEGGYCDRILDIDIIDVDNMVIETPELSLPHPRMHLRDFVLTPLSQLDPEWRHPVKGKTAAELLKEL